VEEACGGIWAPDGTYHHHQPAGVLLLEDIKAASAAAPKTLRLRCGMWATGWSLEVTRQEMNALTAVMS
jgi:hypothetical protein